MVIVDNVIDIFFFEIYVVVFDLVVQDQIFVGVVSVLFGVVLFVGDFEVLVGVFVDVVGEGCICIWSVYEDEEFVLVVLVLGGMILEDIVDGLLVGVLMNDIIGGKMDYYICVFIVIVVGICCGLFMIQVSVIWMNMVFVDVVMVLLKYVIVDGFYGVFFGSVCILIVVFGLQGVIFDYIDRDGEEDVVQMVVFDDCIVVQYEVILVFGELIIIMVEFQGMGVGECLIEVLYILLIDVFEMMWKFLICVL